MEAVEKLYWSELKVGAELPPVSRGPLQRLCFVRYAGAAGSYDPMHVDEVAAKEAGMPGVTAPPMLLLGLLGEVVGRWRRGNGCVRRFGGRFVKMVWPGDVVTCRGRVLGLHHATGSYTAEVDLWAENQVGELVVKGSAVVELFHCAEDEARRSRGEPPLIIDTPPPPALEDRIGVPMAALPRRRETARDRKPQQAAAGKSTRGSRKAARPATAPRTVSAGKKKAPAATGKSKKR